ncbi:MAG: excinuclease ABC subunit UvrA, partial [Bacteroidota bacterium]
CQGFGRVAGVDEDLVIPNPDLSIRQGAIAPFRTEQWSQHMRDLIRVAARLKLPIDVPFSELSEEHLDVIWNGQGEYIGIRGFFRYLEKRSYKMHYRIFSARFRGYTTCPDCNGYRLRPEALYVKLRGLHIGEAAELTVQDAYAHFREIELNDYEEAVAGRVLEEIVKRLRYLNDVGLDYLTLDRLAQTLSGGESQRINLATSLGSSLVGSLYVLDEPSIGLHPRDTDRLVNILEYLRDLGNTVIVVEHDDETMRRADHIVDMGPAAGTLGGDVVFEGDYGEIVADEDSLTGQYLSRRKEIPVPETRRPVDHDWILGVHNARAHNLKRLDVDFPLRMITCVTGVSGSGKSTLVHTTLYNGLARLKGVSDEKVGAHDLISGHHLVDLIEMVDQSPIGQSPRSNPATYVKVFDDIRKLFADTHQAKVRGYKPGYFSFNVPGGRCETCQGEGAVKVEMQFLADLYLECEACKGKRFKKDVLEIRVRGKNIDDVLNMTVDEALAFFELKKIRKKLQVLQDVGLGYLSLGQPATTLSGGEAQRIKLAYHLSRPARTHTLYIFDEPTTGLHFSDIEKLLKAFNALVDAGHSIIVIEHNLDVIKCADWVIDLGPEGGRRGGFVVAAGTPEDLAAIEESHTGRFLVASLGLKG